MIDSSKESLILTVKCYQESAPGNKVWSIKCRLVVKKCRGDLYQFQVRSLIMIFYLIQFATLKENRNNFFFKTVVNKYIFKLNDDIQANILVTTLILHR